MSEGKTIKTFGDYSVTLDAKGAVLVIGSDAENQIEFYPDTAEEARDLAGALNTVKRIISSGSDFHTDHLPVS